MIKFTGTIQDSSNSMIEYVGANCTLNIYLVSATAFSQIQAAVQIGNITATVDPITETFNPVTNLITYNYPIETGTAFEFIQDLVLTDLEKSYPNNSFSIIL